MYALVNTLPPIDGEGHGVLAPGVDGHFLDDVLRQRRDLSRRRNVVGVTQPESAVGALTARVDAALLWSFVATEHLNVKPFHWRPRRKTKIKILWPRETGEHILMSTSLGHGEERLGPAGDVNRLQVAEGVRRHGQLDLGPLQAAELILVVEAPHVDLGGLRVSLAVAYAARASSPGVGRGAGVALALFGVGGEEGDGAGVGLVLVQFPAASPPPDHLG